MKLRTLIVRRWRFLAYDEEGGALAELAILVPLLVVMLAAVAEFGRYFQSYTTLAKSTRAAARYLSNHPFTGPEQTNAKNLAACGKLTCVGGDALVKGVSPASICIESTGSPKIETVTVRIPRTSGGCGAPVVYEPILNIGALLHSSLTMQLPLSPNVTMYYMLD